MNHTDKPQLDICQCCGGCKHSNFSKPKKGYYSKPRGRLGTCSLLGYKIHQQNICEMWEPTHKAVFPQAFMCIKTANQGK